MPTPTENYSNSNLVIHCHKCINNYYKHIHGLSAGVTNNFPRNGSDYFHFYQSKEFLTYRYYSAIQ